MPRPCGAATANSLNRGGRARPQAAWAELTTCRRRNGSENGARAATADCPAVSRRMRPIESLAASPPLRLAERATSTEASVRGTGAITLWDVETYEDSRRARKNGDRRRGRARCRRGFDVARKSLRRREPTSPNMCESARAVSQARGSATASQCSRAPQSLTWRHATNMCGDDRASRVATVATRARRV